ncbi:hypothetical protein ACVMFA_002204 [Bradyrhizobium liaoningense]
MSTDRSGLENFPQRDEDERDEGEMLARPHPTRSGPDFPDPDDDPSVASAESQRVSVVNRPLPTEGVPNCSIRIGAEVATTNQNGNADMDLSGLADGSYNAAFLAPDTS